MDILQRAIESGADLNAKDFWKQVAMKTRIADPKKIKSQASAALKSRGFLPSVEGLRVWAEYEKERSRIAFVPEIAAIDDAFSAFGDGMNEKDEPVKIEFKRAAILSDIHFGFHDLEAVKWALKKAVHFGADMIYLNGDILDCHEISRHDPKIGKLSVRKELELVNGFFERLRSLFPNAQIIWKAGNHCARWQAYLEKYASRISDLKGMDIFSQTEGANFGVQWIDSHKTAKAGRLNILHGHEAIQYVARSGQNPAQRTLDKNGAAASFLIGDVHRTSSAFGRTFDGERNEAHSTGCLCYHQGYAGAASKSTQGMALVELFGQDFEVQNLQR
jgi:hypothetical protein